MKSLVAIALTLLLSGLALAQNEQAPIVEKEIKYKDWTLKDSRTDAEKSLRNLIHGKKLAIVVYYAPWCPNWRHDAPMVERLYEKYKDAGLEIIGVSEYDLVSTTRQNLDQFKITFPAVYESQSRDDREKTTHYDYRKSTGDTRKWGSPYYVFIDPSQVKADGDTLLKKTHVINGEMIESEGEAFIRQHLGLKPEDPKTATAKKDKDAVEVCDPAKPTIPALKKPDQD